MAEFTIREILEATGGRLIRGCPEDSVCGVSIDSRTVNPNEVFIAIKGERFDGHNFVPEAVRKQATCIIVSQEKACLLGNSAPPNLVSVKGTIGALSQLAYVHRKRFGLPVICVTGSNGKTTTKEMLAFLLSSSYKVLKNEGTQNNLIGLSLNLLKLEVSHELAVLELGTNHFGELKELARVASPNVGIITNIGPAHLEYFGDTQGVLKEKWQLIEELAPPRLAIINSDDILLRQRLASSDTDVTFFTFGMKYRADFMARRIYLRHRKLKFVLKNYPIELNTISRVNVYNALASFAVSRLFSIDAYDIIRRFRHFEFPKSRLQLKRLKNFYLIDDTYNANPASFSCAIEALGGIPALGRKIVVMGDMLELGKEADVLHRAVGSELAGARLDLIIAIGPLSHLAADSALSSAVKPKMVYKCASVSEASCVLKHFVKRDDTVLLKGSRGMHLEEILTQI